MLRSNDAWWLTAGIAAVLATRLAHDAYTISVVNLVFMGVLMAAAFRFVMLIGEMPFASAAFVGIGAYSAGVATTILHWPFLIAMLIGPVLVIAVSAVFGFITLRIKGPYFMLIGFAFSEAVRIGFSKSDALGGTSGMVGIYPPRALDPWLQTFVAAVVVVAVYVLHRIEHSDFGKLLKAIKDNDNIARTVGINVLHAKVLCFVIAAFCAGIVGGLMAFVNNVISPGDFSFMLANFALAYVKVGGERSLPGAIGGAVLLVLLGSFAIGLGAGEQLFYGAAIVLAILLMPNGIAGIIEDWRVRRVASRQTRSR